MIKGFFGRISGLDELAQRYSTPREPQGKKLTKQTVQIGAVRYRRCVTVHLDPEGLFLQIEFIFCKSRNPFFIPWHEIKQVQETKLYWEKAALLLIGNPPVRYITLPKSLYKMIEPHLYVKLTIH